MIKYNSEDLKNHDGVAGVIKNKEGKILMLDHVKFNFWTIPVGKVKEDETVIEGLEVEMFEEIGITIKECREVVTGSNTYERNGSMVEVVFHIFEIEEYEGEVLNKEVDKHRDLKWMTVDEIKGLENISDSTRLYLDYLKGI